MIEATYTKDDTFELHKAEIWDENWTLHEAIEVFANCAALNNNANFPSQLKALLRSVIIQQPQELADLLDEMQTDPYAPKTTGHKPHKYPTFSFYSLGEFYKFTWVCGTTLLGNTPTTEIHLVVSAGSGENPIINIIGRDINLVSKYTRAILGRPLPEPFLIAQKKHSSPE